MFRKKINLENLNIKNTLIYLLKKVYSNKRIVVIIIMICLSITLYMLHINRVINISQALVEISAFFTRLYFFPKNVEVSENEIKDKKSSEESDSNQSTSHVNENDKTEKPSVDDNNKELSSIQPN